MGANNWRDCLACERLKQKSIETRRADADKEYGKIPATAYRAMVDEIEKDEATDLPSSLREDYEFYLDVGGELSVTYRCSCDKCGFSFSLEETKDTGIVKYEPAKTTKLKSNATK